MPQLMNSEYEEGIENEYEILLEELKATYVSLSSWNRVGNSAKRIKEISWSTLETEVNNKILKKPERNHASSPSIHEAIF